MESKQRFNILPSEKNWQSCIARQVLFRGFIFRLHDWALFFEESPLLCLPFCLSLPRTLYCVVLFVFFLQRNSQLIFINLCIIFLSFRSVVLWTIWAQPLRPCAQSSVSGQWVNWCKLFYLHWHTHLWPRKCATNAFVNDFAMFKRKFSALFCDAFFSLSLYGQSNKL